MGNSNAKSTKDGALKRKSTSKSGPTAVHRLVGDYNCVRFQRVGGAWNPFSGAIHYQLSLRKLYDCEEDRENNSQEDDISRDKRRKNRRIFVSKYSGSRPDFTFVLAEHGYVIDSKKLSAKILTTVREGDAQIFGRSIVLKCRKELQKLMLVSWHDDGRPPSAEVLREQICAIQPASRVPIQFSNRYSLLTMRKLDSGFAIPMWKSSSRRGLKTMRDLDELQALFGTKLQWVSDVAKPIEEQLSIAEAREHYTSLDALLTQYDPDFGESVEDTHESGSNGDNFELENMGGDTKYGREEAVEAFAPTHEMFVARDVCNNEETLIAVRDVTNKARPTMISIHDLDTPHTCVGDADRDDDKGAHRLRAWASQKEDTPKRRMGDEDDFDEEDKNTILDSPVYPAVWDLLGSTMKKAAPTQRERVLSLRWIEEKPDSASSTRNTESDRFEVFSGTRERRAHAGTDATTPLSRNLRLKLDAALEDVPTLTPPPVSPQDTKHGRDRWQMNGVYPSVWKLLRFVRAARTPRGVRRHRRKGRRRGKSPRQLDDRADTSWGSWTAMTVCEDGFPMVVKREQDKEVSRRSDVASKHASIHEDGTVGDIDDGESNCLISTRPKPNDDVKRSNGSAASFAYPPKPAAEIDADDDGGDDEIFDF